MGIHDCKECGHGKKQHTKKKGRCNCDGCNCGEFIPDGEFVKRRK